MSLRYAKEESKPYHTCDIRQQYTPSREQIPYGATFQCHFPLEEAKTVFGFASGVKPIW